MRLSSLFKVTKQVLVDLKMKVRSHPLEMMSSDQGAWLRAHYTKHKTWLKALISLKIAPQKVKTQIHFSCKKFNLPHSYLKFQSTSFSRNSEIKVHSNDNEVNITRGQYKLTDIWEIWGYDCLNYKCTPRPSVVVLSMEPNY